MPLLELAGVEKVYDRGRPNEFAALRGVSFSVDRGELVAVMGPSGSGKSTLLHILGCLDAASAGRYVLDGADVERVHARQLVTIRREKVGFVFQNFNLLPRLSVWNNVELPLVYRRVPRAERTSRVGRALDLVGLADKRGFRPTELSGGQQQRVAIARAIVGDPALILADEPTGNLDTKTGQEIVSLLLDLHRQGRTIVIVTHDERVANVANRLIKLQDGRVTT